MIEYLVRPRVTCEKNTQWIS